MHDERADMIAPQPDPGPYWADEMLAELRAEMAPLLSAYNARLREMIANAAAPTCRKCGRADDLHVQDGTATCHPCMLDDDLARHFADQRRRAANAPTDAEIESAIKQAFPGAERVR